MSARSEQFDKALRGITDTALTVEGFVFDGSRTFRRIHADKQFAEIIHFQLGQRSHSGRFTVNLGIFVACGSSNTDLLCANEIQCAPRQRLGHLVPTPFQSLSAIPFLGQFFGPGDTWWRFSSAKHVTEKSVGIATGHIVRYGLPWLSSCRP